MSKPPKRDHFPLIFNFHFLKLFFRDLENSRKSTFCECTIFVTDSKSDHKISPNDSEIPRNSLSGGAAPPEKSNINNETFDMSSITRRLEFHGELYHTLTPGLSKNQWWCLFPCYFWSVWKSSPGELFPVLGNFSEALDTSLALRPKPELGRKSDPCYYYRELSPKSIGFIQRFWRKRDACCLFWLLPPFDF